MEFRQCLRGWSRHASGCGHVFLCLLNKRERSDGRWARTRSYRHGRHGHGARWLGGLFQLADGFVEPDQLRMSSREHQAPLAGMAGQARGVAA